MTINFKEHCERALGFGLAEGILHPKLAALFILLSALFALGGWALFPEQMHDSPPWVADFHPLSAIGFVFLGFLLRLSRWESFNPYVTRLSVALRLGIVGAGTLILVTGRGWLDRALVDRAWAVDAPDRWPSEVAGIGLVVLGVTMFLKLAGHQLIWGQLSLGLLALFSLTGLLGHLYGARGAGTGLMMDPATALLMMLAALTLLYAQARGGPLGAVVADSVGSTIARRLLPASILVPIALGWLRMVAEQSGWLLPSVGLLVHVLASIAVMSAIVFHSAAALARTSRQKHRLGQQFDDIESSYKRMLDLVYQPVFAYDEAGRVTYLNPAARQLFSIDLGDESDLMMPSLVGQRAWERTFAPFLLGMRDHNQTLVVRNQWLPEIRIDVETTYLYRSERSFEVMSLVRSTGTPDTATLDPRQLAAVEGRQPQGRAVREGLGSLS